MTENKHYKLKISQLQALVAVADCGNFSLAALHLDLSQSTVSHAIATLEEELGVVLLMRGRYGAKLTPVGEQVIQEARQVLQLLESIEKKATIAKGLQGGQVRVASIRSVATHVLPAVIALFREKFSTIGVAIAEYARYRQGLGVTVMPRLAAEPIPQGVQVRSLPAPLARTIVVAVMAEALHPPAVFAFLDTLDSCCLEERSAVVYEVR